MHWYNISNDNAIRKLNKYDWSKNELNVNGYTVDNKGPRTMDLPI